MGVTKGCFSLVLVLVFAFALGLGSGLVGLAENSTFLDFVATLHLSLVGGGRRGTGEEVRESPCSEPDAEEET